MVHPGGAHPERGEGGGRGDSQGLGGVWPQSDSAFEAARGGGNHSEKRPVRTREGDAHGEFHLRGARGSGIEREDRRASECFPLGVLCDDRNSGASSVCGSECREGSGMKLIGLMLARNEDWVIGCSLRAALRWCDAVVVALHACIDETQRIVSQISKESNRRGAF